MKKQSIPIDTDELGEIGIEILPLTCLNKTSRAPHRDDHYTLLFRPIAGIIAGSFSYPAIYLFSCLLALFTIFYSRNK